MSDSSPPTVRDDALDDAPDDGTLVRRVAGGDETAFMSLYDRHAGLLFGTAVRFLRDREAAAEVVQDVFVAIWQRAGQFDPRSGSAVGWFVGIARNRSIDRLRADARRPSPAYGHPGDAGAGAPPWLDAVDGAAGRLGGSRDGDPAAELDRAWTRALVRTTLAEVPPDERRVVVMAYDQGLSQSEIADRLGVPIGTVKSRTRRALARLRLRLADVPDLRDGAGGTAPAGSGRTDAAGAVRTAAGDVR